MWNKTQFFSVWALHRIQLWGELWWHCVLKRGGNHGSNYCWTYIETMVGIRWILSPLQVGSRKCQMQFCDRISPQNKRQLQVVWSWSILCRRIVNFICYKNNCLRIQWHTTECYNDWNRIKLWFTYKEQLYHC